MKLRASKAFRVTRRNEIDRLFRKGRKSSDARMTLFALPNDDPSGRTRLMVGVSMRHGKAVRRNRVKRLCREAFRSKRGELPPGMDYAMVPRVGGDITLEGLTESLVSLAGRLKEKLTQGETQ